MSHQSTPSAGPAMLFEIGLGFVGIFVAWLGGIALADQFSLTQEAVLRGAVACLPLLLTLLASYELQWRPLRKLRQDVERVVRELFHGCRWWELALVSIAAGVGEEILFRGALQPLLASWTNVWFALAVVSLLFGAAHAISLTYFLAATFIGVYFGALAISYQDVTAPIVAHALYDFIALLVIQSRSTGTRSEPPAS